MPRVLGALALRISTLPQRAVRNDRSLGRPLIVGVLGVTAGYGRCMSEQSEERDRPVEREDSGGDPAHDNTQPAPEDLKSGEEGKQKGDAEDED
jgi:hypothetical protein